jgi:hypothetical protein
MTQSRIHREHPLVGLAGRESRGQRGGGERPEPALVPAAFGEDPDGVMAHLRGPATSKTGSQPSSKKCSASCGQIVAPQPT